MVCPNCGACIVYENFYRNNEPLHTWKCILCGEYVGDEIMENRPRQKVRHKRGKKR